MDLDWSTKGFWLPDSPLDNLQLMVDTVHAFSNREGGDEG